jgi:hypothetical protein
MPHAVANLRIVFNVVFTLLMEISKPIFYEETVILFLFQSKCSVNSCHMIIYWSFYFWFCLLVIQVSFATIRPKFIYKIRLKLCQFIYYSPFPPVLFYTSFLSCVATVVFSVRLLHAVAFSK